MLTTRLCAALGIERPIISAAMGGATTPELAAAVSNAGGLGQLTVTGLDAEGVVTRVRRTRELTERPFAANVILDIWKGHEIDAALTAGAPIVFLFWGDPAPHADAVHRAGAKLIVQVGSVDEAVAAADAGADIIVAQGFEAGGHVRGTTPVMTLVPAVVDAVPGVPIVAAGGIVDGRGLAAALALGADGALMGTRFLAADEAFVHPEYRRRILESDGETVYSTDCFDVAWPSAPHRMLRNRVVDEWEAAGRPKLGERAGEDRIIGRSAASGRTVEIRRYTSFTATPAFDGDIDEAPLWAGMGVGRVRQSMPAARIVGETVSEAEAILERLSRGGSARSGRRAGRR
jgi:nitronate monooxygenase